MSAPNPGRQSPEPENQTEGQSGTVASNPNEQGGAPTDSSAKEASNEQKSKLPSNPEHILAASAEEKTSKK
ncbi:hypothetical protein K504DRAFT_464174 [Pleomassaria siparia CBS 279.74]|uniref:Uncharacterized protein n=1 Tax=Pleomassaria siparia CBS 279.74 TaxID=1314801 RepID=A0A6G1KGY1_9PLEO|nr:hypothetical protein K504DRAFT_464174 [Pleomassaria siparia CBS 279.74]